MKGERLIRFEFPEAVCGPFNPPSNVQPPPTPQETLEGFVLKLQTDFNITLLHFRKQGGGTERVLVGMQVPEDAGTLLEDALARMHCTYFDETQNPVYLGLLR